MKLEDKEFRHMVIYAIANGIPIHDEIDIQQLTHYLWEFINNETDEISVGGFQHYGAVSTLSIEDHTNKEVVVIRIGPNAMEYRLPGDISLKNKEVKRPIGIAAVLSINGFGAFVEENYPHLIENA